MNSKAYSVDLAGHMAVCEANYFRLLQLLPELQLQDRREFLLAQGESASSRIRIDVLERCPYTTMLEIRQIEQSSSLSEWTVQPQFQLRVYHDAKMAEVIACRDLSRIQPFYEYPNAQMLQRDEKQQLNRFLAEWLSHCLRHGFADESQLQSTL